MASIAVEVMLRPDWPGVFRRQVRSGKQSRVIEFRPNQPVTLTAGELDQIRNDVGVSLFEIERDEKNRPRFVETVASDKEMTGAEDI